MNYFFQPSELPLSQCFRYPDHVCLGYSLWANRDKKGKFLIAYFLCAYMPVYRVPYRLKFSTVSSHMIKCLLTEFGGASGENIWLGVMKKGPHCAQSVGYDPEPNIFQFSPSTQSIRTQYFGFVRQEC